jgi:hypothetical protein
MGNIYDWQVMPSLRWPYTGDITNKKYLKDRNELFAKSGNGWWWYLHDTQNPYLNKKGEVK